MPTQLFERARRGEHALLIQPHAGGPPEDGQLEEFADLARSAGATVVHVLTARIDRPNPATLLGSGKLEEVKALADASGADLILVNHLLSPGQERNLEKLLERRVVDRTGLILDIFSQRARSAEGKLQVELAQLRHMATRLIRGWTHLERQRGGSIGLRGPGETQLETDRRLLQKRVEQLQKRLDKVDVQRTTMRRARVRSELPRVALVGYTNAGKSTLFNALTGAGAYADDRLFATLDPTVRRLDLPVGGVVLADTVGFVRDLPHELVAAFRSTLSEAREADVLLHVIDAADPLREERIAQVDAVLQEIGAGEIPQLLVYNKIDRLPTTQSEAESSAAHVLRQAQSLPRTRSWDERGSADSINPAQGAPVEPEISAAHGEPVEPRQAQSLPRTRSGDERGRGDPATAAARDEPVEPRPIAPRYDRPSHGRARVWVSARDALGLDLLGTAIVDMLDIERVHGDVLLPAHAGRLRARLHALDAVREEVHDADGWRVSVDLALADAARLAAQDDGAPLRALLPTGQASPTL